MGSPCAGTAEQLLAFFWRGVLRVSLWRPWAAGGSLFNLERSLPVISVLCPHEHSGHLPLAPCGPCWGVLELDGRKAVVPTPQVPRRQAWIP